MKTILFVFSIFLSINAHAWTAIAYGENGHIHLENEGYSKEYTEKGAIQACNEYDENCSIILSGPGENFFAVVRYDGGVWAAYDKVLKTAEKIALDRCNKEKKKNCRVSQVTWDGLGNIFSLSTDGERDFGGFSYLTEKANELSLQNCKKESKSPDKCKFKSISDGFISVSNSEKTGLSGWSSDSDPESSKKNSIKYCGQDDCKVIVHFKSGEIKPAPKELAIRVSELEKKEKAEKLKLEKKQGPLKNVGRITCTNQCINGSCVRTFADGRKEKWTAPRVFNPLTNTWDWDINTNACGIN